MMDALSMSSLPIQENTPDLAITSVIDLLLEAKFIPNEQARVEIFQNSSANNPLLGKSSKCLAKIGGRLRFEKIGTNIKATVSAKTTYFYFLQGFGTDCVKSIASHDTKNINSIKTTVDSLCVE